MSFLLAILSKRSRLVLIGTRAKMTEQFFQETIENNERILNMISEKENEGVWVFGYGSLMWKANFKYQETRLGYIYGHARRLWQQSRDHRGTPEKPGLVATLVPVDDAKVICWGLMYYIPPEYMNETMNTLNFREKDGYSLKMIKCHEKETNTVHDVITYISLTQNDDPVDSLAQQIAGSEGPSGPNSEYLFNLADTLRQKKLITEDDANHLFLLERKVRDILLNNKHMRIM